MGLVFVVFVRACFGQRGRDKACWHGNDTDADEQDQPGEDEQNEGGSDESSDQGDEGEEASGQNLPSHVEQVLDALQDNEQNLERARARARAAREGRRVQRDW